MSRRLFQDCPSYSIGPDSAIADIDKIVMILKDLQFFSDESWDFTDDGGELRDDLIFSFYDFNRFMVKEEDLMDLLTMLRYAVIGKDESELRGLLSEEAPESAVRELIDVWADVCKGVE